MVESKEDEIDKEYLIKKLTKDIESQRKLFHFDRHHNLVLSRNFTEAWFSDTLAWLLDPKGSHGFGVKFILGFLRLLGEERCRDEASKPGYEREKSFLKLSNDRGKGRNCTGRDKNYSKKGFSLSNGSCIREFFLSGELGRSAERGRRYCDIVFMDMDLHDGVMVFIENKLFTTNHGRQLEDYYEAIENKFGSGFGPQTRELVYLTLNGDEPKPWDGIVNRHWLCVSWTRDIKGLLDKLCGTLTAESEPLKEVSSILSWLARPIDQPFKTRLNDFKKLLLQATAECLTDELSRLNAQDGSFWKVSKIRSTFIEITYSRYQGPLRMELLPNFTITVQKKSTKGRQYFEKIIVPFGTNSDQVFNLICFSARDIYELFFDDIQMYKKGNVRRRTVYRSDSEKNYATVFDFAFKYENDLKLLLLTSNN